MDKLGWRPDDILDGDGVNSQHGQGMIEYGLIVGLVSLLIISVMLILGPNIERMFSDVIDQNAVGEREASLSTAIHN